MSRQHSARCHRQRVAVDPDPTDRSYRVIL